MENISSFMTQFDLDSFDTTDADKFFASKKSRKHHPKKKKKDIAMSNMEILESGKVRIGNTKFDIGRIVDANMDEVVVSRLDGIVSKEGTKKKERTVITTNSIPELRVASLVYQFQDKYPRTIVIPIKKEDAMDTFNYLDNSILGEILRTSTLAYVYRKVKKSWVKLNKNDTTGFTNVMFVPDVLVFLDEKNGKILKQPFKINVLLMAFPINRRLAAESSENPEDIITKVSDTEKVGRIIADIGDAVIKCGARSLIVDPFGYPLLSKKSTIATDLWVELVGTKRFQEQIERIDFSLPDENDFIIFGGRLRVADLMTQKVES